MAEVETASEWLDAVMATMTDLLDIPVTDSSHRHRRGGIPAVTCHACHKPTTGEVWVRPDHRVADYQWEPTYFCEGCAHIPIPPHGYTIAGGMDYPGTCWGCSRRFHARAQWRLYCTPICAGRARARRYYDEHLRATPTEHACEVCGKTFTARADARTCSGACRQKAYRQRPCSIGT